MQCLRAATLSSMHSIHPTLLGNCGALQSCTAPGRSTPHPAPATSHHHGALCTCACCNTEASPQGWGGRGALGWLVS